VLKNKDVSTTIPSITDNEQLEENLKAMSASFSDADQKILAAQLDHISPLYCRMCGSCSGQCPKGLPVSDVLRYVSYAEGYGQFQLAREISLCGRSGCALRDRPDSLPEWGPRDRNGQLRRAPGVKLVVLSMFPPGRQWPRCLRARPSRLDQR
jgi:ferredoxin